MGLPTELNPLMITYPGYIVGRSLRFRSSASAYLTRTPASAGNQQKFTISFWAKLGSFSNICFLCAGPLNSEFHIGINGSSGIELYDQVSGVTNLYLRNTTAYLWRDPSAWYHYVFAFDSTQATASNRARVYVNGIEVTSFGTATYPAQNYNYKMNSAQATEIGRRTNASEYYDGYLAEFNSIDGQQLTPSSFGSYDGNGIWQPVKYSGTYGTNGFYLPFKNTTSTTTLVQDSSGNGNNWTPNNISLTAGTTYDSMIDSPTVSASSSNYAVLNPINVSGGGSTITDGNLACSAGSTTTYGKILGSIGMSTGKWYWEVTITAIGSLGLVGIGDGTPPSGSTSLGGVAGELAYQSNGNKYTNATATAYGATYTTNDVIGVAYDADAGSITFYKNNASQGAITGFSGTKYPAVGSGGGTNPQYAVNFGQRPFSYTPPSGYVALNTYNLPTPTIGNGALYMAATTYTSNGGVQTVLNSANNTIGTTFKPDLVWTKPRSNVGGNIINDSVRGASLYLTTNTTNAELTDANYLTSFNSNGFSLGSTNFTNGYTMVGWQWNAGSGSSSSNTNGSITSTVSVNQTAGFSIATFTAATSGVFTVGHGLGVAPDFFMIKARANAYGWDVYHKDIGNTKYLVLNSTAAAATDANTWNNTSPTSTVFTLGLNFQNTSTWVAYCFAAVKGYSAFGSYTGNGSTDGPFIYTGFRPRFVMIKRSSDTGYWIMKDSSRNGYNQTDPLLYANVSDAEYSAADAIDILSNGFKVRASNLETNGSGSTLIYAAFAESPFKISRAR